MASQKRKPRMVKVTCRTVRTTKRSRRKPAMIPYNRHDLWSDDSRDKVDSGYHEC